MVEQQTSNNNQPPCIITRTPILPGKEIHSESAAREGVNNGADWGVLQQLKQVVWALMHRFKASRDTI